MMTTTAEITEKSCRDAFDGAPFEGNIADWPEIQTALAEGRHELVLSGEVIKKQRQEDGEFAPLPSSVLFSLVELNFLEISNLSFDDGRLDSKVGNLCALSKLVLRNNSLTDLPLEIGNLPKLKYLDLAENQLCSLPETLSSLPNLQVFNVSYNLVETLPDLSKGTILKLHDPSSSGAGNKKGKKNKNKKQTASGEGMSENGDDMGDHILVRRPCGSPAVEIFLSQEAVKIRPHLVCCIVRGLDLNKEKTLKSFLQIQNKLHDSEKACNKRLSCTIATHDLSKVKFPLRVSAKKPEEILIKPLRYSKDLTGEELVAKLNDEAEQLRKKEKRNTYSGIHKYLHLLKDLKEYPCLVDAEGTVISFPPITNSDLTKMESMTVDLLLEVSGSQDQGVCKRVMDNLVADIFNLELMDSLNNDGNGKKLIVEQAEDLKSEPEITHEDTFQSYVKVLNEKGAVHVTYPDRNDLKIENLKVIRSWEL